MYAVERVDCRRGCDGQGKVRERRKVFKAREKSGKNENFFEVREKSVNFLKSQGKSLILSKSVKSEGILLSGL